VSAASSSPGANFEPARAAKVDRHAHKSQPQPPLPHFATRTSALIFPLGSCGALYAGGAYVTTPLVVMYAPL
jgi:hypothetical protein